VPLLVWELFLTQTRGAIASLGTLGLLVLEKRLRWPILILVVLIFLAYIIGIIPIPNNLEFSGRRFLSLDPQIMLKDRNWVTRVDRNKIAIAYILSHPFSGIALGQPPADPKYNEIASWVYNTYLHWGVAMGIPAMLAFTVLMLYLIKNAIRNFIISEKEMKVYQLSILIALLIWLINQFTTADSLTYLSDANSTLFFYAVVGMVLGQSLTYKTAFPVITGRREASARTNNKRQ
jgi:O-antigen ligase